MQNPELLINLRSFLQIAPYLAMRGVSPIEFFRRQGITPNIFQNPDIWLPRTHCFHIANAMAAVAQDPFAGAYVGHITDVSSLGVWGSSVLASGNVAQACAAAAIHAATLHQGGAVHVVTEGRSTRLIHRFTGAYGADPRQFILGSLAVLRKIPLMTGEPAAIRVHLKERGRKGDHVLEESLGAHLEMGSAYNMIEFDRELLGLPLHRPGPHAEKCTTALDAATRIAGLLIERIADPQLTLPALAAALRLSPRTLQRRLKYCGIDLRDLHDETRRGEALRLIMDSRYSATDIAYMIGYSDPAHFTRAFKRWTGQTPSRFVPPASH